MTSPNAKLRQPPALHSGPGVSAMLVNHGQVRWVATVARFTLLVLILAVAPPVFTGVAAQNGATGIGDLLFPKLGNGGYDVDHYALDLTLDVADGEIDAAIANIDATATQSLSAFNLDFRGLVIDELTVDGQPAAFRRANGELTITPTVAIADGAAFETRVVYHGRPERVHDPFVRGWWHTDNSIILIGEPSGGETVFPVNGHPADAATYGLTLRVPPGFETVTGGALDSHREDVNGVTDVWSFDRPLPSYLFTFHVGNLTIEHTMGPKGIPLTLSYPGQLSEQNREAFARTPEMIDYFSTLFGPLPAERFGATITDANFGAALETEGMVVYSEGSVNGETIAHELAHHWFGNSVRLKRWSEIWLNEGFARYAEALWLEHEEGATARDEFLEEQASRVTSGARLRIGAPDADNVFNSVVYSRGALTLHALRAELGDEAFFGLLQAWARDYAGQPVMIDDFIALAEARTGTDLDAFFQTWLYSTELPEPLVAPVPDELPAATPVAMTPVAARMSGANTRL